MQISHNGLEALKESEGFRANAYPDSGGTWTIGYGTTVVDGKPVMRGMTCTQQQAELWLEADLARTQTVVNRLCGTIVNQNQFDALVNFAYNEGSQAFAGSTMLRKILARDYKGAAAEFPKWDLIGLTHDKGLAARRLRERSLFEK